MFRGPFFEVRDEVLLLGESVMFGIIFQKDSFKLLKPEKS